jgi:hypothetical protein
MQALLGFVSFGYWLKIGLGANTSSFPPLTKLFGAQNAGSKALKVQKSAIKHRWLFLPKIIRAPTNPRRHSPAQRPQQEEGGRRKKQASLWLMA